MQRRAGVIAMVMTMLGALLAAAPVGAAEIGEPLGGVVPPGGRFFDDDGSTHEGNIEAIAGAGITLGCNAPYQTAYCPGDDVTRAQMATFLVRGLSLPATTTDYFGDDTGNTHEANINAVALAGISLGCGGGNYCPNDPVSRDQMASFLARALDLADSSMNWFTDDEGNTHEANINKVADAGISLGCGTDLYCPDDPVTRAQMGSFLARALGLPTVVVPAREITFAGEELDFLTEAELSTTCDLAVSGTCNVALGVAGEFFMDTAWVYDNWTDVSDEDRAAFMTDEITVTGQFDGQPIELFEWDFYVDGDDRGVKAYSFQFPDWLTGEHVLSITFIDNTVEPSYVYTINTTITTSGGGYPLGASGPFERHGGMPVGR